MLLAGHCGDAFTEHGRRQLLYQDENKKGTKICKGKGASRGNEARPGNFAPLGESGAFWTPPGGARQPDINARDC
jgi:hypothetical protein